MVWFTIATARSTAMARRESYKQCWHNKWSGRRFSKAINLRLQLLLPAHYACVHYMKINGRSGSRYESMYHTNASDTRFQIPFFDLVAWFGGAVAVVADYRLLFALIRFNGWCQEMFRLYFNMAFSILHPTHYWTWILLFTVLNGSHCTLQISRSFFVDLSLCMCVWVYVGYHFIIHAI